MTISLAVPDILVARAQSGDLEALEALYRAFETPVYNLALRVLRRPEDAEDVLQETFLEVVRSIKQYRGEGHLWGWIRQIAASKALMRIRREQVRQTEELYEESAAGVAAGAGATAGRPCATPFLPHGAVVESAGAYGVWRRPPPSQRCSCSGHSGPHRSTPPTSRASRRSRRRSSSSCGVTTPTAR